MHEFRRTNSDPIYGFDPIEFLHLSDYKGFGTKSLTKLQVHMKMTKIYRAYLQKRNHLNNILKRTV